jgi:hypothetical protein
MTIDTDKCVSDIREIGHCVLPGLFPPELMEQLHHAFLPLLGKVAERLPDGNRRNGNRWAIGLPFGPPFYDSRLLIDETVLKIVRGILGENAYVSYYGTDTPGGGATVQHVHADLAFLFPEEPNHAHPPALLSLRFPFVDVTAENGPYSVALGTQNMPREETIAKVEEGSIPLTPLLLKAGDAVIVDPRTLHRGTPNKTDAPRPFAVICYNREWYGVENHGRLEANEDTPALTQSFFQTLSEQEQRLLRRVRRT